jgi:hypothetical protein
MLMPVPLLAAGAELRGVMLGRRAFWFSRSFEACDDGCLEFCGRYYLLVSMPSEIDIRSLPFALQLGWLEMGSDCANEIDSAALNHDEISSPQATRSSSFSDL